MATSPTSTSSFDFLSASAPSDDEIVYLPQESTDDSSSDSGNDTSSLISDDDDFVLLSRARSPCSTGILSPSGLSSFSTDDALSSAISSLSMSQSSAAAFIRDAVSLRLGAGRSSTNSPVPTPATPKVVPKATKAPKVKPTLTPEQRKKRKEKRERKKARKAKQQAQEAVSASASRGVFSVINDASSIASQQSEAVPGLTKNQRKKARKALEAAISAAPHSSIPRFPIVDDASSIATDDESTTSTATVTGYEDASDFITGYLSSPEDKDTVNKLTLLQALILELGVSNPSSLPTTITSAKKLLKSEAHVNIREYMAVREEGQDALKGIMHASRSSLVKSIRKKKNPASLTWVKQQGLSVLLVQCFC